VTRPGPDAGEGGFTLLELLVALVVLGLLVIGLAQGVRAGLALRQAQTQRLGQTAELDAAMRLLRTVLTRLPFSPDGNRVVSGEGGFKGEPDRLSFLGEMPTGLGTARRAAMSLYVRNGHLLLSWAPSRHERRLGPPLAATDTELLSGVSRLDLAYWGPPSGNQPAGWRSRWEETEPPDLVRVRLSFRENDRRRWPDLIAASKP